MDALTALSTRQSSRSFGDRDVPREIIQKIIEAGRLAATARNDQPWEFIVVTNKEMLRQIARMTSNGKFIEKAPVCVAVFCKETKYYLEDGSAATQNMLVAATALGVHSCWVAGDKKPYCAEVARLLKMPEGYKLVSLTPFGYEDQPTKRPEKRSLSSVLHWECF
ncbi:MAG: nitroreductase family protein [Elusimicrobia bacterium]|nr:nitroreductase family protein [Candidatus Obscuribacterium magneticum]